MKSAQDIQKIRAMKESEIVSEIKAKKKEHSLHTLKVSADKSDDFAKIDRLKKYIARLNTILKEKQSGAENGK